MKDVGVIEELKRIAVNHNGILRGEDVVKSARSKASPLHDRFTWDDTEAAEQYRLFQARQLIRVSVQVLKSGDEFVTQRVFVSLSTDRVEEGGGYRPLVTILSDDMLRAQLVEDALEEMVRFHEKYQSIKELASVFQAMQDFNSKHPSLDSSPLNQGGKKKQPRAPNPA